MTIRTHFVWWLAAMLCVACVARAQEDAPTRRVRPAPVEPQPEEENELSPVSPPDSEPGRELGWVMGVLNGAAPGDVASHFTDRYMEKYPVATITDVLTTLREKSFHGAKVNLVRVNEEDLNNLALSGTINGEGTRVFLTVFLSLDDKSKKIAGLLFNPAVFASAGGGEEGPDELQAKLGGTVLFGAYEIISPGPEGEGAPDAAPNPSRRELAPIYEFGRGEGGAVAGLVRLWVLDAIGERIKSKSLAWDQAITIRDEYKCIPGGATSGLEAGRTLALSDMVERMCAKADTTAMEHLFRLATREKIEAVVVRDAPQTQPPKLPLLSVREMFALKLSDRDGLVNDYLTDPEPQRREKLAPGGTIATLEPEWTALDEWTQPRLVAKVGYFATPESLGATLAHLKRLGGEPGCEHLLDAMASGVPIDLDKARWPASYGAWAAEPGVAAAALMVKRSDGRWFAIVGIWNNEKKDVEGERLDNLMREGVRMCDEVDKPRAPANQVEIH